jgi:hypothetical protein
MKNVYLFLALAGLMGLLVVCSGCTLYDPTKDPESGVTVMSDIPYDPLERQLITIDHDDHLYVVYGDSVLHHPSCPCNQ